MLLADADENRLLEVIEAMVASYALYLTGRPFKDYLPPELKETIAPYESGEPSLLDVSYLAGKVANAIGPDKVKNMSEDQITAWIKANKVMLDPADQAKLDQMKDSTERWLEGRQNAWKMDLSKEIDTANKGWNATVETTKDEEGADLHPLRYAALGALVAGIVEATTGWLGDVDRLVLTEMNSFFQLGQVAGEDGDELVYKIPRPDACEICWDLHVDDDGSPIMYKLGDVLGNSNVGLPQSEWDFTLGSTHPYCYCVLYFASDGADEEGDEQRAKDKKEAMDKSLRGKLNGCDCPDDPDLLFEEQLGHNHPLPNHLQVLIKAVKRVYGDRLPKLDDMSV